MSHKYHEESDWKMPLLIFVGGAIVSMVAIFSCSGFHGPSSTKDPGVEIQRAPQDREQEQSKEMEKRRQEEEESWALSSYFLLFPF